MTKKLSTNDIFAKIEKGEPVDVKEVEFVSPDTMRDKLYAKITEMPSSINHFADLCGIYPSHLHEFLKGTKNLGRDKLIIVCIVLKLNLSMRDPVSADGCIRRYYRRSWCCGTS